MIDKDIVEREQQDSVGYKLDLFELVCWAAVIWLLVQYVQ